MHLFELAREPVDQFFLLVAHLVRGQMPDRLDVLLELRGELAEEFVARVDLLLQVFFGASDSVEGLGAELVEVVLEADEVALHLLKVVPVVFEILLLLLGDLLAKCDLLVGLLDGAANALVLLILLVLRCLQGVPGSHLVHLNVLLKVVVTDL